MVTAGEAPSRRRRSPDGEAEKLELILKLMAGAGLLVCAYGAVQWWREGLHERVFGAVLGAAGCASLFVPWSRLPGVARLVQRPGRYLGVLSKLLLTLALATLPVLCVLGHWLGAAVAALVVVLCLGLWLSWTWVAWLWYAGLAALLFDLVRDLWQIGTSEGVSAFALALLRRAFGLLMMLVLAAEVVEWHRGRRRARASAGERPAPSSDAAGDDA